jgi:hypothetical protein
MSSTRNSAGPSFVIRPRQFNSEAGRSRRVRKSEKECDENATVEEGNSNGFIHEVGL